MEQYTPITATFIWTFDDLKARQEALAAEPVTLTKKSFNSAWLTYGILATTIVLMIIMVTRPEQKFLPWANVLDDLPILIPVVAIFWAIFTFLPKRTLKQTFLRSPDSNKRVDVTITTDEILMKVIDVYESRWKWASIIEVRRTPKGFCFFQAPKAGFWIPIRAFQSTADVDAVSGMASRLTPKFIITIA